ncbi:MAG: UDP-N-acetylglucosamine 2-epimerase (non-hydrolyzing) [Armatimonadota bacterium]|nr:MAG: UDP-N-acetylglucosamine 2-epimerase (non-hydrolyzing) [Armatimonadota bacterium]
MKIVTVLGTRPEIIRLSRVIPLLDEHADHVLAHTGQNYDKRLSDIFFEELGVRIPDRNFDVRAETAGEQIGRILIEGERLLLDERPDAVLILGDTNSGLIAIVARRLGIPVFHMEAGNRCFDDRVPEEVNRRAIDHCSSVSMPYTQRSKENLIREGISPHRIYVTGNPILEVIRAHSEDIRASRILDELGLDPRRFFLVTLHRAENVDLKSRLHLLGAGLLRLHERWGFPVVCGLHPRTRSKLEAFNLWPSLEPALRFLPPFGFCDFLRLEQEAACVLTDSGTVQEECCIFGVPAVTLRDVTERPETIEAGGNVLSGAEPDRIEALTALVMERRGGWTAPPEYLVEEVAPTVARIILGYDHWSRLERYGAE